MVVSSKKNTKTKKNHKHKHLAISRRRRRRRRRLQTFTSSVANRGVHHAVAILAHLFIIFST
jgi:hypothetical protein